MGRTTIEWTRNEDGTPGRNWNVTRGCSRISPGCQHCYAERIAERFCDGPSVEVPSADGQTEPERTPAQPFHTFAERGKGWTRKVALLPEMLAEPLRWRKPSRVFVCSTSDLFHEALSDEDIAAVFGVMAAAPQHQFQVLTKRAKRMREWFAEARRQGSPRWCVGAAAATGALACRWDAATDLVDPTRWPLPNVWLGVSVEDQKRADERVPHLLATPAAVRWVSYEPALGPVDFSRWLPSMPDEDPREVGYPDGARGPTLDWIVVGGESGPGARPFDLAWARSTIRQCREAGVACFVKQLGGFATDDERAHDGAHYIVCTNDRKGGDPAEWPIELQVREWPEVTRG